jgi:hypothetical protein
MDKEQRTTILKSEIQRIAWSNNREDRDRCLLLKRQLARLCLGPASSWDDAKCEWSDSDTDDFDDLAPYHAMADTLRREDNF